MSYKITAFRLLMQKPLVQSDFLLFIPRIAQASILAQATTFPTEELQSVKAYRRGNEVELPTRFKVDGIGRSRFRIPRLRWYGKT